MHERPENLGDPLLERVVEHHLAAGEAPHDLGREVIGGRPEAAARHDHGHPLCRHEPERRHQIVGAIADDLDHRCVDAELGQALGQPGSVAVGDDPGQDLGARDEDPGAGGLAHAQVGSWPAGNGVVFPGVSSYPIGDPTVGVTDLPLIFIWTESLPSVTMSFGAVSDGIAWPAA